MTTTSDLIAQQPERREWLDIPLLRLRAVDWVLVAFGLVVLAAILTRFWDLGSRALHHDESLHAVFSYYLYTGLGYRHDPLMHGPFLFHFTALIFWLFGDSDFTVRVGPAIFGVALVAFPWLLRDYWGRRGALIAAFLTLISPSVLYYSRFIRHDIFAIMWSVIIVYAIVKYLDEGRDRWLVLLGAGMALSYSTKEVSYILSVVLWTFLLLVVTFQYLSGLRDLRRSRAWHLVVVKAALLAPFLTALVVQVFFGDILGLGWKALDYSQAGILRSSAVFVALFAVGLALGSWLFDTARFATVAAVFYTIFILLHTTFLTNGAGLATGFVGALGYWLEQHDVRRGDQPWYYYLLLLWLYEYLVLLVGLVWGSWTLFRGRHGPVLEKGEVRVKGLFPVLLLWWLVLSFIAFSIAGEKMPWLSIHMSVPAIWLAAWTLNRFFEDVNWEHLRRHGAFWFALPFTAALVAALTLLYLAFRSDWPFRGNDLESLNLTARWLAAFIVLLTAGSLAWRLGQPLGSKAVGDVAVMVGLLFLVVMTVRHAWLATYVHGDIAREMLIYTQTTPDVTMVTQDLEMLSRRLTGGLDMVVAYDNETSWPFEWYLRHFPNKRYYGAAPTGDEISGVPVVLVGLVNESKVKPYVADYVRFQYKLRWWFPEEYKDLRNPENEYDLGYFFREFLAEARDPQSRRLFLDFLLWRKLRDPLGSTDFVMYVRPDLVQEIWQYGNLVQAVEPSLVQDVYRERKVTLAAVQSIGTFGEAPGQFNAPKALAFAPDGKLVVADSGNHRIQVFDANGQVVTTFGRLGALPGEFNEPWGVAVDREGNIYVADTWNHRVQKFAPDGTLLTTWGTFADTQGALEQPGVFWGPRGIFVTDDGRVFVADTGNKRVQVFDTEGRFLGMFGGGGSAPGKMDEPTAVAVAPDGTIYVADTWNRRVQAFSPDFAFLRQWPINGWRSQSVLNKPFIATDGQRVWVTDPEAHRVIEFDATGNVLRLWGQFGNDMTSFNLPLGLAYRDGRLAVADSGNNRILLFDVGP